MFGPVVSASRKILGVVKGRRESSSRDSSRRARRSSVARLDRAVGVVEQLESRRLLSGCLLAQGVLYVVGSDGPDNITVQLVAGNSGLIKVRGAGSAQTFSVSDIHQINMDGGAGNDLISLSDIHGQVPLPAFIVGGAGNDSLSGSAHGHDTIVGGTGKDMLVGNGGPFDSIEGDAGPDTVSGGGSDQLNAGPGTNLISSNNGQSFIEQGSVAIPSVAYAGALANMSIAPLSTGVFNKVPIGLTPEQIRSAYGAGLLAVPTTTLLGQGQTIAIVDAFDNPTVLSDLTFFSKQFGLPAPTPQTFEKVFAADSVVTGGPIISANWVQEIDLDVEWAHVLAPDAKIILVESANNTASSVFNAVQTAATLVSTGDSGGGVVSMSFGVVETTAIATAPTLATFEYQTDHIFESFPSVSFVAAAGDTAGALDYPAMSPYVTSVGGTTLTLGADGKRISVAPWVNTGGGVSTVEPEPDYQSEFQTYIGAVSTLVDGEPARVGPDVSMDAGTGVAVYDTTPDQFGFAGWQSVGGTSLSTPMFGAVVALGNQARAANGLPPIGNNLNNLIYFVAADEPGAVFSLGASTAYSQRTGVGEPIAVNFAQSAAQFDFTGSQPTTYSQAIYLPLPGTSESFKFAAQIYGNISSPITGSGLAETTDLGTATVTPNGPDRATLILTGPVTTLGSTFILTAILTEDPQTNTFFGTDTADLANGNLGGINFTIPSGALPVGSTLEIYFTGTVTPDNSGRVVGMSGSFYLVVVNPDGSMSTVGHQGIGGSGSGDLTGSFETS